MTSDSPPHAVSVLVQRTRESIETSRVRVEETTRLCVTTRALLAEYPAIARPLMNAPRGAGHGRSEEGGC